MADDDADCPEALESVEHIWPFKSGEATKPGAASL
jgi:hypothetical protein